MNRLFAVLLMASCLAAHAQEEWENPHDNGYAGPFGKKHAEEKRLEGLAIGKRVQRNLGIARDRDEVRYAANRRRCQAALHVSALCGRYAGRFSCDEKGFQPIAPRLATKPAALDNSGRYRMERCALEAGNPDR